MMTVCETANDLWQECVRTVNLATSDEYALAWHEYQEHRRSCQECKDHFAEYLKHMPALGYGRKDLICRH